MNDVTQILSRMESGDSTAADQLLPLVYDELRRLAAHKLAQESPGNTLQATALVHEAYLRLVDVDAPQLWDGRGHFFAAAAEAMRRILVNRARDKKRLKRGGGQKRLDWNRLEVADGNGNNTIDVGDYGVWKQNFGRTSGAGSDSSAVPEPASFALMVLGLVAINFRRSAPSPRFAAENGPAGPPWSSEVARAT